MTTLKSYDLNGKKLSFANWISNLSPQDTPFTSMTGKESIQQTLFQWQTDALSRAGKNAQVEGDTATEGTMRTTSIKSNITQILRKTVKVSDTANALANFGRGKELQYQMEKAGKEIKRDLEWAFLNNIGSAEETATVGRVTAGFRGLVAGANVPCPETGAVVHSKTAGNTLAEADLFKMTMQLYLAGSHANIIMFHPKHASFFSSLQEKGGALGNRSRIFENTPKFSVHVSVIIDPLGQEYKLIPNRWMPEDCIYFFNSGDWTQMVLRAPSRVKLAKDGSYEKWMLEMEVGLRHRHPYASGVLEVGNDKHGTGGLTSPKIVTATLTSNNAFGTNKAVTIKVGEKVDFKATDVNGSTFTVYKDGKALGSRTGSNTTADTVMFTIASASTSDAGIYTMSEEKSGNGGVKYTDGIAVSVKNGDNGNIAAPVNA